MYNRKNKSTTSYHNTLLRFWREHGNHRWDPPPSPKFPMEDNESLVEEIELLMEEDAPIMDNGVCHTSEPMDVGTDMQDDTGDVAMMLDYFIE